MGVDVASIREHRRRASPSGISPPRRPRAPCSIGLVGRGIAARARRACTSAKASASASATPTSLIDFDRHGSPTTRSATSSKRRPSSASPASTSPIPSSRRSSRTSPISRPRRRRSARSTPSSSTAAARIGHNTDSWGFAESFRAGPGRRSARQRRAVRRRRRRRGGRPCAARARRRATSTSTIPTPAARPASPTALTVALRPHRGRRQRPARRASAAPQGIVNATPVGMDKVSRRRRSTPRLLAPRHWVADIVYFPAETELLRRARAHRLPHARRHRHGGLPGRQGLRALHRPRARPATRWPSISRRPPDASRPQGLGPNGHMRTMRFAQ